MVPYLGTPTYYFQREHSLPQSVYSGRVLQKLHPRREKVGIRTRPIGKILILTDFFCRGQKERLRGECLWGLGFEVGTICWYGIATYSYGWYGDTSSLVVHIAENLSQFWLYTSPIAPLFPSIIFSTDEDRRLLIPYAFCQISSLIPETHRSLSVLTTVQIQICQLH